MSWANIVKTNNDIQITNNSKNRNIITNTVIDNELYELYDKFDEIYSIQIFDDIYNIIDYFSNVEYSVQNISASKIFNFFDDFIDKEDFVSIESYVESSDEDDDEYFTH